MSSRIDRWGITPVTLAGAACVLLAAFVPSMTWLDLLREVPPELQRSLTTGATIFRATLAVLGVYLIVGQRARWWSGRTAGAAEGRVLAPPPTSGVELGFALGVIAVGAVLRLRHLGGGMWVDEVTTLVESVRLPLGEVVTTYGSQNQHFLFSVLAHLSIASFGESAWALRLPAAILGIGALWALWRFGRLVATPREAVLATVVLTFSYQHIWFSQNARGYSILLFWTIVSSHALLCGLREGGGRWWVAYAVATALGMYTHMTMIFVVAGQFAVYAWHAARARGLRPGERLVPFFGGFVLAGLLTVLCYALVLPQIPAAAAADRSDVAVWRSPLWMLREIGQGAMAGSSLPLVAIAGLAILVPGVVSLARQSAALPLLFAIPVLSGTVTMIGLGHHLWPRFYFFAAGFAVIFVVRGIVRWVDVAARWFRWSPSRAAQLGTISVLLAVAVQTPALRFVYEPKQDHEGAVRLVEQLRQPGDAVVTVGRGSVAFRVYFAPAWTPVSSLLELDEIRRTHDRMWLVYAIPIEVENSYPEIFRAAQTEFKRVGVFGGTLNGGTIFVYLADRREPTGEPAATPDRKGT